MPRRRAAADCAAVSGFAPVYETEAGLCDSRVLRKNAFNSIFTIHGARNRNRRDLNNTCRTFYGTLFSALRGMQCVCTKQTLISSINVVYSLHAACLLVHGQVTIIFVVSVGLSVCLCRVFLSRLWSDFRWNLDICYVSGSSCVA